MQRDALVNGQSAPIGVGIRAFKLSRSTRFARQGRLTNHGRHILSCLLFLALGYLQTAAAHAAGPQLPNNPPPGTGIQRTMRLLATSTLEHPNHVSILFYGQSISKQPWWLMVARDLKARYPSADLKIENRAVGGFAAPLLVKSAEYDLYPANPDLIVFHDYGDEPDYEKIIRRIRARTKAEVALQTDHLTNWGVRPGEEKGWRWVEWHNSVWLPQIARKYRCGLIDVRAGWKRYLTQSKLQPSALLIDDIHLNADGIRIMGDLVEQYLQYNPGLPHAYEPLSILATSPAERGLDQPFTGNRVDVIAERKSFAPTYFWIDGRRPSQFRDLPIISRPNDIPGQDWPWQSGGVIAVGHRTPLVPELWSIKIDSLDQNSNVSHFELSGSVTGFDGRGSTDQRFVSSSGRVVLDPENWWTRDEHNHYLLKQGQLIQWRVLAMSADQWSPRYAGDTICVASGLPNTRHVLHLRTDGRMLPIRAIIVQKPSYTEGGSLWLSLMPPYTLHRLWWLYLRPPYGRSELLWLSLALLATCIGSTATYLLIKNPGKDSFLSKRSA
jgi:hypothetical protein